MKLIILTTDTTHHLYFIKSISKHYNIEAVLLEKKSNIPKFDTYHPFEGSRDIYEKKELLNGKDIKFKYFCKTLEFDNINDEGCLNFIVKTKPDVIVTFGTGLIKKPIIDKCKEGIINLHGGDPQYYRGLDSHLWAIYHKDFCQLKVSLHKLNRFLDDGEIIQQKSIKITKDLELYMLRSINTKICVELTLSALEKFSKIGYFKKTPQKSTGRYYSFMPSVLKEICLSNFNQYLKKI